MSIKKSNQLLYGDLYPIEHLLIPLTVLFLDFVTGLSHLQHDKYDAVLFVINKTTKFIIVFVGKTTYMTADWAMIYLTYIYLYWGLSGVFISDMDPKFLSRLWQVLYTAANIKIQMSITHYQNANGQAECIIQMFIVALVTIIGGCF